MSAELSTGHTSSTFDTSALADRQVGRVWIERALDSIARPNVRVGAAGAALAISSITMLAWLFELDGLLRFGERLDVMRFNTAVMLALLACAALLAAHRHRSWSSAPSAVAGIFGAVTLLEFFWLGFSSIDQLVVTDWTTPAVAPGRPSAYSAAAILLLALAMLAGTSSKERTPAWGIASATGGLVVALVAALGTVGSFPLPDVQEKNMALRTALVVALLACAALGTLWGNDMRPLRQRRLEWIPVISGSSAFVGVIITWMLAVAVIAAGTGAPVAGHGLTPVSTAFAVLLLASALGVATFFAVRHAILAAVIADDLRESERRFRATFENAAVGIAHVAPDGSWLRVNDKLCEVTGYSREELLTKTFQDITHPDDLQRDIALAARVLAGEIPNYSMEKRYFHKTGDVVWINLTVSLVRKANGAPDHFVSIVEDIDERKRAKRDLIDSQARLANLVESAATAIVTIDVRGAIESINTATEKLFGYDKNELVGHDVSILMPEPYRSEHGTYFANYLETGVRKIIGIGREVSGRRKDGATFPLHLAVSEFEAQGGRHFTGIIHDLTDRKRMEEALIESERRLAQSQKMEAVGHLTGSLAHDFNNLLTVIGANLELLEPRLPPSVDAKLLREARDAVAMGARLTERLLTFSRKRRLEPTNIDLYKQVIGMAELLRRTLGETIELNMNLTSDLWHVRVDAGGIENAILNLALNGRDAMPRGGELVIEARNVTLHEGNPETLLPGDYVHLAVSDSGTGMPAEVLQHAFEPFFTTKGPEKGTGLGLSSVYGFVKQSGGHTSIRSMLGRGTTVDIYLPRLADADAEFAQPSGSPVVPMVPGATILAVEDNPLVRRSTVRRLEALGLRVIEAESGLAAVKLLENGSDVDLVFSDVVMPGGMSGIDLARWIREERPDLKIVLTSGYAEEIAGELEHQLPEVPILRKPYHQAELLRTLANCLNADAAGVASSRHGAFGPG